MAKKAKMTAQVFKAQPKRSDNFTKVASGQWTISFRTETNRFTLYRGEDFVMSCQGYENIVKHSNNHYGTNFVM